MRMLNFLKGLIILLKSQRGCGGDDEEAPAEIKQSPRTKELEDLLFGKASQWSKMGYGDWLSRFTVPESPLNKLAIDKMTGLFATQDYGIEDLIGTENKYLDTLLNQYKTSREEGFKPIKERLIGENLWESGPGFGKQAEYAGDTSKGIADIANQWAFQNIQTNLTQKRYMDALKRGDISSAYNMALSEQNRALQPIQMATGAEYNMGFLPSMSMYSNLTQQDMARYNASVNAYQMNQEAGGNFGGLGMGLGGLAGGLLGAASMAVPGGWAVSPLIASLIGGAAGGGIGSMFKY